MVSDVCPPEGRECPADVQLLTYAKIELISNFDKMNLAHDRIGTSTHVAQPRVRVSVPRHDVTFATRHWWLHQFRPRYDLPTD